MDATQIILIVFIVLLVVFYIATGVIKNKKDRQAVQELVNSLKRGDKVMLSNGVYGKIVDLRMVNNRKVLDLETGYGKNLGYITVDAEAVYMLLVDEEQKVVTEDVKTEKTSETTKQDNEVSQETEKIQPEEKQEKVVKERKTRKKKE